MLRVPSLRLRVAAAFAIFCTVTAAALGTAFFAASEKLERALVTQLMEEEILYATQEHERDAGFVPGRTANMQTYIVRDAAQREVLPAYLRNLGSGYHNIEDGDDEYHVLVRQVDAARFYIAYDVGAYENREHQFKNIVLALVAVVAAASLLFGYLLSGLVLRQVTELAERVGGLAQGAGASDEPLARTDQDSEVAQLARALDDYRAGIAQSIRREREFSANASHELRTPLTAIQTGCELLAAEPGLSDGARVRVASIRDAAQRMAEQIQTLLFLARGGGPARRESVALAACVASAVEPYRGELARRAIVLLADIDPAEILLIDPQALQLVLENIFKNAVEHTQRGVIRVSYSDRTLNISDTGTGIAAEHLPHVFERFYRADKARANAGLGLGLAIVKSVCDHFGWQVAAHSAPGQGTRFSITFA